MYRKEMISSWGSRSRESNNDPLCFSQTHEPHSWWKVFERFSQMDGVLKNRGVWGQLGQFHSSSSEVGQSLTDLTPLFPTVRESVGHISLKALRRSQQTVPNIWGDVCAWKQRVFQNFSQSTPWCETRLMMAHHTRGSWWGIWNLQLSNLVIC